MERKIGEIFEYDGEWYQCVGGTCRNCSFYYDTVCKNITTIGSTNFGNCHCSLRTDHKSVIFKKLEKVGEPYEHCGKLYQCYKLPMEVEIRLLPNNCNPIGKDNLVEIEIKQTKEDMEKDYQMLLELKVIDVILMPEFEQSMQLCIDDINRKLASTNNWFLKRSPIDRLKEQGSFRAKELVALYALALNKELNPAEYPSSVRRLIKEIGNAVLHRTVEYLKAKEEKVETIMIKKEEDEKGT